MSGLITEVNHIYQNLADDLSKSIFETRLEWLIKKGGVDKTIENMYSHYKTSRILGLENFLKGRKVPCVIAGAGAMGDMAYKALRHAGYEVIYYIDNDTGKQGKKKNGVLILSFSEYVMKAAQDDSVVVIDGIARAVVFHTQLVQMGYDPHRIFFSSDYGVRSAFGNIYFDLPQLECGEEEVFIDAGSFNGESTLGFIDWCGKQGYKKVYAFEPLEDGCALTRQNLCGCHDIELLKCVLGEKDGTMGFMQRDGIMGSQAVSESAGGTVMDMRSIDSVLKGERATFIKMDIEGSELAALKGARKTLEQYKPKLAISLYHKPEDILDIPEYILSVRPDYKLYLRQYSNMFLDLVLYAV